MQSVKCVMPVLPRPAPDVLTVFSLSVQLERFAVPEFSIPPPLVWTAPPPIAWLPLIVQSVRMAVALLFRLSTPPPELFSMTQSAKVTVA